MKDKMLHIAGEVRQQADAIVARYETKRAAMLEVLRLLMERCGHITPEIEEAAAEYLGVPPIEVREVVSFYTLYHETPKAQTRFCVCRTLSCSLKGADEVIGHIEKRLGIKPGEATPDGKFSLEAVECLGACETAPSMQLNDDQYVGHLTAEKVDEIIRKQSAG
jgi:NADH-quinone oxidoreductase E subunit